MTLIEALDWLLADGHHIHLDRYLWHLVPRDHRNHIIYTPEELIWYAERCRSAALTTHMRPLWQL